ncbi:hypothetical protein tb265_31750 [Gemmatimonadetes bacterium T265]|nr:hypothetical protein tb265_31750 [Gemmatimonadetes bacterium T265]
MHNTRHVPHPRAVAFPPHPPVFRFLRRSQGHPPRRALPIVAPAALPQPAAVAGACTLASCRAGSWATVMEVHCGDQEACRLRALGLCEGARINVVDARNAVLLEVRGTRIALGRALGAGITVRPIDATTAGPGVRNGALPGATAPAH